MRHRVTTVIFLLILVAAAILRLIDLTERPMHPDEATGARILSNRMESGVYRFDPKHFHGPTLSMFTQPVAELRGEQDWQSLSKFSIRIVPAIWGLLTLAIILPFARQMGKVGALCAIALVASSPLLVYYNRMFIHESLLGFFALASVVLIFYYIQKPSLRMALASGVGRPLLMPTKDTFAVSYIAWGGAAGILLLENRSRLSRSVIVGQIQKHARFTTIMLGLAALLTILLYTDFGSNPRGVFDFIRTFFVYELTAGHEKYFFYYAEFLVLPKFLAGRWWSEGALLLFAIAGYLFARMRGNNWARFLAYASAFHFLVYSIIRYKTPWLMLVPWLHVCLLAGYGVACLLEKRGWFRYAGVATFALVLAWQTQQAFRASFRFHSDGRNPYAYVPTARDVEPLAVWLEELADKAPEMRAHPVAVVGPEYWPLPWYLRSFSEIGYWQQCPDNAREFPLLLSLPWQAQSVMEATKDTHVALPRGLRHNVPLMVFLRNDIWIQNFENE